MILGGAVGLLWCILQEMSYNNYLDADAAWACVSEFDEPTCVIVKHTNPCGVASAPAGSEEGLKEAYRNAVRADPVSAFGGIVAFNVPVTEVRCSSCLFFSLPPHPSMVLLCSISIRMSCAAPLLPFLLGGLWISVCVVSAAPSFLFSKWYFQFVSLLLLHSSSSPGSCQGTARVPEPHRWRDTHVL